MSLIIVSDNKPNRKMMKKTILLCFFLSLLLVSCQGSGSQITQAPITSTKLDENQAANQALAAIEEIVGLHRVQANWVTINGDIVFAINYLTDLNPKT